MTRFLFALFFIVAGGNFLHSYFEGHRYFSDIGFLVNDNMLAFLGGFLLLYGLRLAVNGWPKIHTGYQLFILGPLMVGSCELLSFAGILLIRKGGIGFVPIDAIIKTLGVSIFLGGIAYAVLSDWNKKILVRSIY